VEPGVNIKRILKVLGSKFQLYTVLLL